MIISSMRLNISSTPMKVLDPMSVTWSFIKCSETSRFYNTNICLISEWHIDPWPNQDNMTDHAPRFSSTVVRCRRDWNCNRTDEHRSNTDSQGDNSTQTKRNTWSKPVPCSQTHSSRRCTTPPTSDVQDLPLSSSSGTGTHRWWPTQRHIILRHVTARHVTSRHVTSHHVTRHVTSHHSTARHSTSRHVT